MPAHSVGICPGKLNAFARIAITLLCCCSYEVIGQNFIYRFDNFTSEQGLTDRIINAVAQDKQGFIWIGSDEGLSRFDGYAFTVYRHDDNDKYSLSDNEVYALCIDETGALWIGTRNGLNRYDANSDHFEKIYHVPNNINSPSANEIYALSKDHAGNIWIGTLGSGLDMLQVKAPGSYVFTHYKHVDSDSNSITGGQVYAIAFDYHNRTWVSTTAGLNIIDPKSKKVKRFYHPGSGKLPFKHNTAASKIYADSNHIWLCGNNMLDKIDLPSVNVDSPGLKVEPWLNKIVPQNSGSILINDFLIDQTGHAWIATNGNGVFRVDLNDNTGSAEQFINDPKYPLSLLNSTVFTLMEDQAGLIWIGTAKGLSKFTPSKSAFEGKGLLGKAIQQQQGFIMSLATDSKDRLWAGTDSNVLRVYANSYPGPVKSIRISIPFSPVNDQVNTIFKSNARDMYIGMLLSGVYIIPSDLKNIADTKGWKHLTAEKTKLLPGNNIYSFEEDTGGKIAIGTYLGLCSYDPLTEKLTAIYSSPEKKVISDYIIRSIAADGNKNLWCATDNGVSVFKNSQLLYSFRHDISDSNSLCNNRVTVIYRAKNKTIWVGTKEGLNYYDPAINKFHRLRTSGGNFSDPVKSISEDKNGNLWIATSHGLVKYAAGENKLFYYGSEDGLYSNQFVANESCTDAAGTFYFGTNNGIISFNPESIKPNKFIPPVVITVIKVFDKTLQALGDSALLSTYSKEQKLVLHYNQNFFSFEFAALNYINTAANQYAYQLEGVDKQWVNAGTQRIAGYTDINPGHYTFKVKAANNDGLWNETPVSIPVIILAPWWQTWWFYSLCFLAASAVIYTIYRVRLKQILKLYRLRSSIAKDLHDDVGSALSSIAMLSRIAQEGKSNVQLKTEEIFSRIGDTSKRMIDLMDDIVWSVNPDNDRFSNMLVRMREYAVEMLEPNGIDFSFKIDEKTEQLHIPMQMRKDYFLIFKEAVNNLAKYSHCSKASIVIERVNRNIITSVTDNGKGFDPVIIHSGNGLKNMQQRAASLKGKIEISTMPGKGTSIVLTIPAG